MNGATAATAKCTARTVITVFSANSGIRLSKVGAGG
jgi:hypothetical protein